MTKRHDNIAQAVLVVDGCDDLLNVVIKKNTDPGASFLSSCSLHGTQQWVILGKISG